MFTVRYVNMGAATLEECPHPFCDRQGAHNVAKELSRDFHGPAFVVHCGSVVTTYERGHQTALFALGGTTR